VLECLGDNRDFKRLVEVTEHLERAEQVESLEARKNKRRKRFYGLSRIGS
jgi:hypothetical protein